jgi:hypothetical protein
MINPYITANSRSCGGGSSCGNENENGRNKKNDIVANPSSMGLQSQRRLGSVKKCLKRGSVMAKYKTPRRKKSDLVQLDVDGGRAFESHRDCIVCRGYHLKAMGQSISIPHKSHHIRCGKNRSTLGSSARTVGVNKFAKDMVAINTRPLGQEGQMKGQPSVSQHFDKTTTTTTTTTTMTGTTTTTITSDVLIASDKGDNQQGKYSVANRLVQIDTSLDEDEDVVMEEDKDKEDKDESFFDFQKTKMATRLRAELDDRMSNDDVMVGNAPAGISHMVHYIMGEFSHRKTKKAGFDEPKTAAYLQSQRGYRQFFAPSEITFTFPSEAYTKLPSPYYHALQKTSYIHVDWEMSHPGTALYCYECKKKEPTNEDPPKLLHDRTNFTKNRHLFPIFDQGGSVIWASIMVYYCSKCKTRYNGNDGRVLQMLDPEVRGAYPVHPRYAVEGATWHLAKELADDLDDSMLTYGNADFFCRKMYNRKLRAYEERVTNYYSCNRNTKHEDYIPMSDWIGDFPPDGKALRLLHERAERSSLTPMGISNFERHNLEIQSVGCSKVVAIDWTFAVVKNYFGAGPKACFTSMNENGEVCTLALVATTKVEEIAHLVEQMRRRPDFRPQAIFTDTWPHNQQFWFLIFGSITGCLGIFHYMKRMVDTLRTNHCKYWDAIIALKDAIYRYDREDYHNLLNALKTGTMAKDKKCYTDGDIKELRHSKKFKQRYAKYLRKFLNRGTDIAQRLLEWKDAFKNQIDPTSGRKLFTEDTKAAVENQIMHVEDIQFPENMEMYRMIPPGPRSTHKLPSYRSVNPEPMLESWHGRFAHFGNTGMRAGLADCLHLRGTAEGNVTVRHKLSMMKEDTIPTVTDNLQPPAHLRDLPVLKDHCLGKYINE